MKNNKGFAITGILYSILLLFLMLLLLVLGNLQARKVIFDKQKNHVLSKIDNFGNLYDDIKTYTYINDDYQEFIASKDGNYLLEIWNADSISEYKKAKVYLLQGVKLYIKLGNNSGHDSEKNSKILMDKNNPDSWLITTSGINSNNGYVGIEIQSSSSINKFINDSNGAVRITYIRN